MEAWPSWKGSALLARRRRSRPQVRVLLPPLHRCDVVQTAGRPAVTRSMLVRAQPSQLTPRSSSGRGCRSLTSATRVRIPVCPQTRDPQADPASRRSLKSAASRPKSTEHCRFSRSRTRLGMRPGCLPGEAGSIPVESALLAVAQWTSTTLLPWPTGVRLLPARLRRKASSEPAGGEPAEQGAIPWRRPSCSRAGIRGNGSPPLHPSLRLGRSLTAAASQPQKHRRRACWAGTALIRRVRMVRFHGRRFPPGCREARPSRRFREPETAGSTPAGQTCAVEERLSSRAS